MDNKQLLTTPQLIKHMESKGINFDLFDKTKTRLFLDNVNYYYKVASYRSNFPKDSDGKYINLDFAYLTDLASIDMQLRDYLLDITLDIEHGIKVLLLKQIANDPDEDGYQVVLKYKDRFPKLFDSVLLQFRHNKYEHDMYNRHHSNMPIWVLMEIISFGMLSRFVEFYYREIRFKRIKPFNDQLKFCKNIRNACAHSNPLLVNLFSEKEFLKKPTASIQASARLIGIPRYYLSDLKINDLVATFHLHKLIQSKKMQEHRVRQGRRLITRYHRHENWYADNTKLNSLFSILNKMIDYLEK